MTATIVFVGDSVTDCDRRNDPSGLGHGYVRLIADRYPHLKFANRGIGGNRVRDLHARWNEDVLAEEPTLVSILVGVNDTWLRYLDDDPTSVEAFAEDYRSLLAPLVERGARIVLVEPFLLPIDDLQRSWRAEDLVAKIATVRELAEEFGATLVPADGALNTAGEPSELAPDGVHPSAAGHQLLAELWVATAGALLNA